MAADAGPSRGDAGGRRRRSRWMVWSGVAILAIYGIGWARTRGPASSAVAGASAVVAAASTEVASTGPASTGAASTGAAPPGGETGGAGAAGPSTGTGASSPAGDARRSARPRRAPAPSAGAPATAAATVERRSTVRPSSGSRRRAAAQGGTGRTPPVPAAAPAKAAARPSTPTPAPARTSGYRDGTYAGTGFGFHGPISVDVTIQGGRIVSTAITACGTRYPCSWISALPREVVAQQTVHVDMVSGATASSEAFLGAVAQALAKAG